jgi:hypothetical protein
MAIRDAKRPSNVSAALMQLKLAQAAVAWRMSAASSSGMGCAASSCGVQRPTLLRSCAQSTGARQTKQYM